MSSYRLIETLNGMGPALAGLRAVFPPSSQEPAVYYICPLSNLRRIATSGILSNASAPRDRTDLSGQGVQARRDIPVNLTRWASCNAHQCINLFWNPCNWTSRAFQRNAMLCELRSNNPDEGVVCILELNLERVLLGNDCNWTIAPQNFAAGNFASFAQAFFTGESRWPDGTPKCDWNSILSVAPTNDRGLNRKRSAELLVHVGDGDDSAPVPFAYVDQIFIPALDIRTLTADQTAFLDSIGKRITRLSAVNGTDVFLSQDELLKSDRGFVRSMALRRAVDANVLPKLNAAFNAIQQFETAHPELSPLRERFRTPAQAEGHHGAIHAARVMFWSAFLVQHMEEPLRQRFLPIVLAAAALHDTQRPGDAEEELHGQAAADRYREALSNVLTDPNDLNSCLNALRDHSIPDDRCPQPDLASQVLKDADALDRGRFGRPGDENGCNPAYFRTTGLRENDADRNIAWMAYWAASSTRYAPFGNTPCHDFTTSLCTPLNHLAREQRQRPPPAPPAT